MQAQEKTASIKQPWHSRADATPNCCFCVCQGCCRTRYGRLHAHTHFCQLSQTWGWRSVAGEKCSRWLLQPFSFASQPAGKPREAVTAHISPEDACATATSPLHLQRGMGFWEHREALPSTPISLHHLCCMSWKQKIDLSSGQEMEKIYTCAMHNC